MKWFVAKICFQIVTASQAGPAQFEEQFRLLQAAAEEEAYIKAAQMGRAEEETFLNSQGRPVQWKCLGVTELTQVPELRHGAELYSAITETSAVHFQQQAKERIQVLQERFAPRLEWLLSA